MSDSSILVEGVSKSYRIWDSPGSRLISPLLDAAAAFLPGGRAFRSRTAKKHRDFVALENITFDVKKGEAVGIIGRNGSGKSTLLQIIAGTLQPTTGSVHVQGRVAALLELGSGFNPEFTGRENVYLNGAVLGLNRAMIDSKFNEIEGFADIGEFIDQPVKTYSSGMVMRLAFAVQTSVDPDILIIDEALAVGDAQFIAKCINRISDFIKSGKTLLFVSHEVGLVKQLTSRAVFLENGRMVTFGATTETALAYTNSLTLPTDQGTSASPDKYSSPEAPYRFESVQLVQAGAPGIPLQSVVAGEALKLIVRLEPARPGPCRLVFSVYNYMGIIVLSDESELPSTIQLRMLFVEHKFPRLRLAPGNYRVNLAIRNGIEICGWYKNALYFKVTGTTTETFIYREDIETTILPTET